MSTRPMIGILHQLAQSGGSLVCRCLAAMHGTAMLHEIHPRATDRFPPLKQARDWYGLVSDEEIHDRHPLPPSQFPDAIELMN